MPTIGRGCIYPMKRRYGEVQRANRTLSVPPSAGLSPEMEGRGTRVPEPPMGSPSTKTAKEDSITTSYSTTTREKKYTWTGKKLMYEKRSEEEEEQKREEEKRDDESFAAAS